MVRRGHPDDRVGVGLRHNSVVVSKRRLRDLFFRSYWVRCLRCGRVQGSYMKHHAHSIRRLDDGDLWREECKKA